MVARHALALRVAALSCCAQLRCTGTGSSAAGGTAFTHHSKKMSSAAAAMPSPISAGHAAASTVPFQYSMSSGRNSAEAAGCASGVDCRGRGGWRREGIPAGRTGMVRGQWTDNVQCWAPTRSMQPNRLHNQPNTDRMRARSPARARCCLGRSPLAVPAGCRWRRRLPAPAASGTSRRPGPRRTLTAQLPGRPAGETSPITGGDMETSWLRGGPRTSVSDFQGPIKHRCFAGIAKADKTANALLRQRAFLSRLPSQSRLVLLILVYPSITALRQRPVLPALTLCTLRPPSLRALCSPRQDSRRHQP